jgi:hypothetical protein
MRHCDGVGIRRSKASRPEGHGNADDTDGLVQPDGPLAPLPGPSQGAISSAFIYG